MTSERESAALDHLNDTPDRMDEGAEGFAPKLTEAVVQSKRRVHVPDIERVRQRHTTLRVSHRLFKQRRERGIAAYDAVERDHVSGWQGSSRFYEVRFDEMHGARASAAICLRRSGRDVRRGRIDANGALDATLEQLKRQGSDTTPDIEEFAARLTRLDDQVAKEPRCHARPIVAITLQVAIRELPIEM
jgi:hypothetical protein